MKILNYLLTIFLSAQLSIAFSQAPSFKYKDGKAALSAYLENLQIDNNPGYSLSVLKGDELILQHSDGSIELGQETLIDQQSTFYLASVSKTFTAVATLILADEKKLNLEDKISDYLSQLPECTQEIRIYHLLNHTSGLPDYYDHFGEKLPLPFDNNKVLQFVSAIDSLEFEPGVAFAYSNTAYVLLSEIISIASGQSYAEFLKNRIFDPLEMENTFVLDGPTKSVINNYALSYQADVAGNYLPDYYSDIFTTGAGGIFSTNSDMVKWYLAIRNDAIISKRKKELMWHFPYTFKGKQSWMSMGWTNETFGRHTPTLEGLTVMGSIGVLKGYRIALFMFPDYDFGFILLCNGGTFPFLSKEIGEAFFEKQ